MKPISDKASDYVFLLSMLGCAVAFGLAIDLRDNTLLSMLLLLLGSVLGIMAIVTD